MQAFGLRRRFDGDEDRAGRLLVQHAAVEADQRDRGRARFPRVAQAVDQVAGKALAAMDGDQDDNVPRLQQSTHLVGEHVFPRGIVGPSGVERDVVGEAPRVERARSVGDHELGEVAGEVLRRRRRAAVAQRPDSPSPPVALPEQLNGPRNGLAVEPVQQAGRCGQIVVDPSDQVIHGS